MILIITLPFEGHLNVLIHLAELHPNIEFQFMITSWKNVALSPNRINKLNQLKIPYYEIKTDYDLIETSPMKWTFKRMHNIFTQCLSLTKSLNPSTILYDNFAIEGYFLGEKLNIPSICSVSSFFTKYNPQIRNELLPFCKPIPSGFDINKLEMSSDGPLIRGDLTLIWNYHSEKFHQLDNNTFYCGYPMLPLQQNPNDKLNEKLICQTKKEKKKKICVSFGTVVMNHLWDHNKSVQKMIKLVVHYLEKLSDQYLIYFAGQGKIQSTQINVVDRFDNQLKLLSTCDLFIFHGGNNSYQEALLVGIPMIIIPFFGDQIHVAASLGHRGKTFSLPSTISSISTESNKFRHITFHDFQSSIEKVILHKNKPVKTSGDLTSILIGTVNMDNGDLLFGSSEDRLNYPEDVGMYKLCPFSQIHKSNGTEKIATNLVLPKIIDIYHDVIRNNEFMKIDMCSNLTFYKKKILDYKKYLDSNGIDYTTEQYQFEKSTKKEPNFLKMCLSGIDFFLENSNSKIHFILSDNSKNHYVTVRELKYLKQNYHESEKIHYYEMINIKNTYRLIPRTLTKSFLS